MHKENLSSLHAQPEGEAPIGYVTAHSLGQLAVPMTSNMDMRVYRKDHFPNKSDWPENLVPLYTHPATAPQGTGSREAVAWRFREKGASGPWSLRHHLPSDPSQNVIVEPLVPLAQLQAVERERDEAWGARNENAKLKGQRDAALTRIKQMQDSNSRMAEGWSALTTRAQTAEASLDAMTAERDEAREALKPFADAAEGIDETAHPDWEMWEHPASVNVHVRDFRRARAALAGSNGEAQAEPINHREPGEFGDGATLLPK